MGECGDAARVYFNHCIFYGGRSNNNNVDNKMSYVHGDIGNQICV